MREMKIEVITDVTIPMMRVVAKPLIGPDPNIARTIPVSIVVT